LPADEHLPDAVFVEDAAVVLDEIAVMTRPRKPIRRMEVPTIAAALTEYRDITHIEAPATLEGGDILIAGRTIFVGLSSRTNQQGLDQFSATVRRYGYRTIPVSVQGCLHLKTAVTALDQDTFLTNPRWIDVDPFRGFRCVEVPEEEPSAANSLALNGVIHLSARSSRTRELLERRGFLTRSLDVTELEKAEAGLTCMSVIFRGERH
jgi:dimethylargininase